MDDDLVFADAPAPHVEAYAYRLMLTLEASDYIGYHAALSEVLADQQASADVISALTTTLVWALNCAEPGWTTPASAHLFGVLDELEYLRETQ